jgi:hypothetical protein
MHNMKHLLKQLWASEEGVIVSAELVLIATILVLGVLVGIASVRDQIIQELGDVAGAVSTTVQSYSFAAVTGHTSSMAGSSFGDQTDFCDQLQELGTCTPDLPDVGAVGIEFIDSTAESS